MREAEARHGAPTAVHAAGRPAGDLAGPAPGRPAGPGVPPVVEVIVEAGECPPPEVVGEEEVVGPVVPRPCPVPEWVATEIHRGRDQVHRPAETPGRGVAREGVAHAHRIGDAGVRCTGVGVVAEEDEESGVGHDAVGEVCVAQVVLRVHGVPGGRVLGDPVEDGRPRQVDVPVGPTAVPAPVLEAPRQPLGAGVPPAGAPRRPPEPPDRHRGPTRHTPSPPVDLHLLQVIRLRPGFSVNKLIK